MHTYSRTHTHIGIVILQIEITAMHFIFKYDFIFHKLLEIPLHSAQNGLLQTLFKSGYKKMDANLLRITFIFFFENCFKYSRTHT